MRPAWEADARVRARNELDRLERLAIASGIRKQTWRERLAPLLADTLSTLYTENARLEQALIEKK